MSRVLYCFLENDKPIVPTCRVLVVSYNCTYKIFLPVVMLKEKNGIASLCCVCPLTVCYSIPFHSVVLNFGRSVRPTPVHTETQDRRTRTGKKKFMQKQQTKIKNKRFFFFLIYCTSFSFYFFISYSFHFIYILLINNKISHPFH